MGERSAMPDATEDVFLGSLLGLAIGDALGMPVAGLTKEEIAAIAGGGHVTDYLPKTFPDGTVVKAGEFTDESEMALCIVESMTTNSGHVDRETIGPRMRFLARGESKRWLSDATLRALDVTADHDFRVPVDEDGPATADVAARGVPIGLVHAVGAFSADQFRADAETVSRITHSSPAATAAVTAVAFGVQLAARGEAERSSWAASTADFLGSGSLAAALHEADHMIGSGAATADLLSLMQTGPDASESVPAAFVAAMTSLRFEDAVPAAVNAGGATDSIGAIAGALAGAAGGVSAIPQELIDALEGRIYISLAAPWFYRGALRRAGRVIDLRPEEGGPWTRPAMPPRV